MNVTDNIHILGRADTHICSVWTVMAQVMLGRTCY